MEEGLLSVAVLTMANEVDPARATHTAPAAITMVKEVVSRITLTTTKAISSIEASGEIIIVMEICATTTNAGTLTVETDIIPQVEKPADLVDWIG